MDLIDQLLLVALSLVIGLPALGAWMQDYYAKKYPPVRIPIDQPRPSRRREFVAYSMTTTSCYVGDFDTSELSGYIMER